MDGRRKKAVRVRTLAFSSSLSRSSPRKMVGWQDLLFTRKVLVLRMGGAKNDGLVKLGQK